MCGSREFGAVLYAYEYTNSSCESMRAHASIAFFFHFQTQKKNCMLVDMVYIQQPRSDPDLVDLGLGRPSKKIKNVILNF
jgi:hypothetical protein